MPRAFTNAIARGARVRTITLPGGKYMHVAFINGRSYRGEVKRKKRK